MLGCGCTAKLSVKMCQVRGVPAAAAGHKLMHLLLRRVSSRRAAAVVHGAFDDAQRIRALCDFAAASKRFSHLMRLGHGPSHAELAWIVIDGREGVAGDAVAGFSIARQGWLMGCAHSTGVLSYCRVYCYGCSQDLALGFQLALESAAGGSKFGYLMVGAMLRDGRGGAPLDVARAVEMYRLAAGLGLDAAQFRLGRMYQSGHGVLRDVGEAARWFRLAGDQGHPWSCYEVGECYVEGFGVRRDMEEAVKWLRRAVVGGDRGAVSRLQEVLGEGVDDDDDDDVDDDDDDGDADDDHNGNDDGDDENPDDHNVV